MISQKEKLIRLVAFYAVMEHIIVNPDICHGKPTITGTRIMVANILSLLAGGYTIRQVEEYYPELNEEQIKAAIQR